MAKGKEEREEKEAGSKIGNRRARKEGESIGRGRKREKRKAEKR